ncbi:ABC transporter substrate-binding protein [Leptospira interrogans]
MSNFIKSHRKFIALSAGIISIGLTLYATDSRAQEIGITDTEILIGQTGPMSGPNYMFGTLALQGAEMIFTEVNTKGGIHGRKIRFVNEDDRCAPEGAVSSVRRLISEHKAFIIHGGACSNATLAVVGAVREAGIPFIAYSAAHNDITGTDKPTVFRSGLSARYEGRSQAVFAASIPNVKRVAIVAQHDAWGQAKYVALKEAAKELGLEIVADEEMTVDSNDATAQVLAINKANPDAIITVLYPKPSTVFIRDAHSYGLTKKPLIGQLAISDPIDLASKVQLPGALDNFYTISLSKFSPSQDEAADLRARFSKYASAVQLSQYTLWGIGSAEIIVEALERAGRNLTRKAFMDALYDSKGFDTSIYPDRILFTTADRDGNKSGTFIQLVDDKIKFIGPKFAK